MPSPSPSSSSSAPDLAQLDHVDTNGCDTRTSQGQLTHPGYGPSSAVQEADNLHLDDRPSSGRHSKGSNQVPHTVPRLTKTPSTPVSKSKAPQERPPWSDKEYSSSEAHLRPERYTAWPSQPGDATVAYGSSSTQVIEGSLIGFDSQDESYSDSDFLDGSVDEPDTGEHFKQATSEFFSKMGGRRVSLLPTWVTVDPDENSNLPASAKSLDVEQHRSTSHERGLEKKRHKELIKEKKAAKAREREIERNLEKERIRRQKDLEKIEKFKSKISRPRLQQDINRTDLKDLPVLQSDDREPVDQYDQRFDAAHKARSVHGYNPFLGDSGDAQDADNESVRSVVRKMKSISILDRLSKKSPQETPPKTLPERTHQSRSRSISSISAFYQRSPTSSSVSGPNDDQTSSIIGSSYLSSKSSMGFHEILAEGPKNSVLSKISTFNNNQRRLPELPSMDDLPDIPFYQNQSGGPSSSTSSRLTALQSHPPVESTTTDYTRLGHQNLKPGRRRMTVSGQYSPDKMPSLLPNQRSADPIAAVSTTNSASESTLNTLQQLSAYVTEEARTLAKNRSQSEKQLRQRRSFYDNYQNQAFTAVTDEPVPHLPKGISPPPSNQYRREETEAKKRPLKCRTSTPPHPSHSASSTGSSPKSALRSEDMESNGLKISQLTNGHFVPQYSSDHLSPTMPPESPSEPYVMLEQQESWVMASQEAELMDLPPTPVTRGYPELTGVPFAEQKDLSGTIEDLVITTNGDGRREMDTGVKQRSSMKEIAALDIQADWESINPSNRPSGLAASEGVDFLHVLDENTSRDDSSNSIHRRRGRMSNLAGSFVKVRAVPGVISPQPKVVPNLQYKISADNDTMVRPTTPNDPANGAIADAKHLTARQRLLSIPSTLLTSFPKQGSPTSPNPSIVRSLKALSPRPLSPKHTLSFRSSTFQGSVGSTPVFPSGHDDESERHLYAGQPSPMTSEGSPASPGFDPSVKRALNSGGESPTVSEAPLTRNQITLTEFMLDFRSRMWFTYRKDIARIEPSYYTSDAGWGCMMRTAQSLLAQGFIQTMLGRDWRADPHQPSAAQNYTDILGWFADEPDRHYSIHNLARSGLQLDKRIGEWFGPSTVAHALKRLSQRHADCPVVIHVPMDNSIRMSDIARMAVTQPTNSAPNSFHREMDEDLKLETTTCQPWKPVVLLIPGRYGIEKLTEKYVYNLKHLFTLPQFLGIAGGRPGRSLYFVACQGNELFYLDPHVVKPKATLQELKMCPANTYHCRVVRTMDILELDPSMLLGFLIKSQDDLVDLQSRLHRETERAYPLITLIPDLPVPKASPPEVSTVESIPPSEGTSPPVSDVGRNNSTSIAI
ncbi:Cysteine protease atg4b [Lunasporangiospora selenospora]|uniref:Autophagy-related protein 4 n=1 Tax=Lunasporangiospora selenospora TaxID=979761 RepID=A0A9P6KGG0_9FUNG|nr:Cysteine protease atg4b [Lunasporangiospora selenospora]